MSSLRLGLFIIIFLHQQAIAATQYAAFKNLNDVRPQCSSAMCIRANWAKLHPLEEISTANWQRYWRRALFNHYEHTPAYPKLGTRYIAPQFRGTQAPYPYYMITTDYVQFRSTPGNLPHYLCGTLAIDEYVPIASFVRVPGHNSTWAVAYVSKRIRSKMHDPSCYELGFVYLDLSALK